MRSLHPCNAPQCRELTTSRYCATHTPSIAQERATYDRARDKRVRALYACVRWQRARVAFLRAHPLCTDPFGVHGESPVAGCTVDHVHPHKGDVRLFWDRRNWQVLCRSCHSRKCAIEPGGRAFVERPIRPLADVSGVDGIVWCDSSDRAPAERTDGNADGFTGESQGVWGENPGVQDRSHRAATLRLIQHSKSQR